MYAARTKNLTFFQKKTISLILLLGVIGENKHSTPFKILKRHIAFFFSSNFKKVFKV